MPHTNRKPQAASPAFKPASFVNITIDASTKSLIKSAPFDVERLDSGLLNLLRDGYKVTLRFDERNDCYACWIVAPDNSPNKGAILSGRGSTPAKAAKQALYIHYVMLEGIWVDDHGLKPDEIDD